MKTLILFAILLVSACNQGEPDYLECRAIVTAKFCANVQVCSDTGETSVHLPYALCTGACITTDGGVSAECVDVCESNIDASVTNDESCVSKP